VAASETFNTVAFTSVDSSTFNNANDRIMAFYSPTSNMIPKVFPRLMSGLSYAQANSTQITNIDTLISGGGFAGTAINAGSLTPGQRYIITSVGTTNFMAIGASSNSVGTIFVATGAGSGTGKVVIAITPNIALGNVGGISSENIIVQGGAFVSSLFSAGPEELLPGRIFDTVSIYMVRNDIVGNIGYRKTVDINGTRTFATVSQATTTTLAQILKITDSTITVADASTLAAPDTNALQPGRIYINGEIIEYYTKVGNVLGQIRRGVGGTGAPAEHRVGDSVQNLNNTVQPIYT